MARTVSIKAWEGTSPATGERICLILTGLGERTKNPKTGEMIQAWIIPVEYSPHKGNCKAMCGDCPLLKRKCYLMRRAYQAPRSVWQGNKDKHVDMGRALELVKKSQLPIRWGAAGDPTMLPEYVVERLSRAAGRWTGYTHQHRHAWAYWGRRYFNASVETKWDQELFEGLGWRTFRITDEQEDSATEIVCANVSRDIPCARCGLCNGSKGDQDNRRSITIPRH